MCMSLCGLGCSTEIAVHSGGSSIVNPYHWYMSFGNREGTGGTTCHSGLPLARVVYPNSQSGLSQFSEWSTPVHKVVCPRCQSGVPHSQMVCTIAIVVCPSGMGWPSCQSGLPQVAEWSAPIARVVYSNSQSVPPQMPEWCAPVQGWPSCTSCPKTNFLCLRTHFVCPRTTWYDPGTS